MNETINAWLVVGLAAAAFAMGAILGCEWRADNHCKAITGEYTNRIADDYRIVCQSIRDVE